MIFNFITLLTALLISSVAIWYSVAGLATIFAASKIPVIIMGTTLEIGKLVSAVWLHRNWDTAVWYLKYYLALAVAVLMFITSMGIFGFLSKSHVEQTSASQESVAQVQRIASEIARNEAIIERANSKISGFSENGSSLDSSINRQIDKEQARIDNAYVRVQPAIDAQMSIVKAEEGNIKSQQDLYRNEIVRIDEALKTATDEDVIKKLNKKRRTAVWRVRTAASGNAAVKAARAEISKIREGVRKEIAASNKLIERLRSKMGQSTEQDVEKLIKEQQQKIKTANTELDGLTEQKFKLEATTRKLEAEVGPIKYIAEFIYNKDADANLLEKAVTWVIILIIFVFDPLAVLLLIATQYAFEEAQAKAKAEAETKKEVDEIVADITEEAIEDAFPQVVVKEVYVEQKPEHPFPMHAQVSDITSDWTEAEDTEEVVEELPDYEVVEFVEEPQIDEEQVPVIVEEEHGVNLEIDETDTTAPEIVIEEHLEEIEDPVEDERELYEVLDELDEAEESDAEPQPISPALMPEMVEEIVEDEPIEIIDEAPSEREEDTEVEITEEIKFEEAEPEAELEPERETVEVEDKGLTYRKWTAAVHTPQVFEDAVAVKTEDLQEEVLETISEPLTEEEFEQGGVQQLTDSELEQTVIDTAEEPEPVIDSITELETYLHELTERTDLNDEESKDKEQIEEFLAEKKKEDLFKKENPLGIDIH